MIMLAAVAGISIPATATLAATMPHIKPNAQRFGARIVDVPVSEANNPRAYEYIVDYLPSNTTIHRRIMIVNDERQTAHFTVYSDAAQISRGLFIGDAGATRSELTGWISVQHPVLTMRPESSTMDMVTIKVPRTATRGEHYGVIWVQQVAHLRTATGLGINEISRVGIRIYLAVGRGGVPPTAFSVTSINGQRTAGGQPSVLVHVRNTGGRAVDLHGILRLTGGPGGTRAGPFPSQQVVTLAPGQSWTMTFAPTDGLPNGPWLASVTLVSGLTTRTATATIQFSRAGGFLMGLPLVVWGAGVLLAVCVIAAVWRGHLLDGRQRARLAPAAQAQVPLDR
jgi:hypothetical protein